MIAIMCTAKLQKALVERGQRWTKGDARPADGRGRLGNWAATLVDEGRATVVAVNERTCLTLVLLLAPIETLRERFAEALRAALLRRRVARNQAVVESDEVARAVFVRLRDARLSDALEFAAFETAAHGGEGQDDESIQEMLNTYPHAGIGAADPNDAVVALFG